MCDVYVTPSSLKQPIHVARDKSIVREFRSGAEMKSYNKFPAEFWATFSYGLLLQRFFWNSSGIFIISIKADTRNFSEKYQQIFLLDAIFLEQWDPFKR